MMYFFLTVSSLLTAVLVHSSAHAAAGSRPRERELLARERERE